jgi:hypothetical protein
MYIPTAANLAGDWSITDPPPGSTSPCGSAEQLYDPNTGALLPGNKYPTTPTYNASAMALEKYFPSINPAIDTNNCGLVKFAIPSVVADNQFVTRVDYTINPRNNFYARYMIDGYQAPSFFFPGGANNGGILVTFSAPGNYERVQTATASEAFTWTSNLVNSFHASGTKRVNLRQSAPGINASNIGITSYVELPTGLQITDSTSGKNHNWSTYCGTCSNGFFNVDDESVADDLTWVKGQHQFVFGGEYVRVHFNEVAGYEAEPPWATPTLTSWAARSPASSRAKSSSSRCAVQFQAPTFKTPSTPPSASRLLPASAGRRSSCPSIITTVAPPSVWRPSWPTR